MKNSEFGMRNSCNNSSFRIPHFFLTNVSPSSETILAFDVGTRHTGVAIAFANSGMAVTKDTIDHASDEELLTAIDVLLEQHHVQHCVLGLPRLPGGDEGGQATFVRSIGDKLAQKGLKVSYIDERYTTTRNSQYDGNAAAACSILDVYISRTGNLT